MCYHDINVMSIIYSKSCNKIFFIPLFVIILFIMTTGTLSFSKSVDEKSLLLKTFAQVSKPSTNSSSISEPLSEANIKNDIRQNESKIINASGHFANNQMKDGTITWIQGGIWNLEIFNSSNNTMENPTWRSAFNANFTMIRPDGSLSHNHNINNLTADNVIFAGNDIVVTGVSHISSSNGTEYEQVPITIHLMGKNVLGLMIDVNKTEGHFAGSNEMYGTLISGIGLNNSGNDKINAINSPTISDSDNSSIGNSITQMRH